MDIINIGKYKNTSGVPQLTKKNFDDAGLDIAASEDNIIYPLDSKVIHTELYLEIPKGYVGLIWSRSGLSVKNQIEVGAGCIDSTYRGEVLVHLYNYGCDIFEIKKGDRIAQLLTIPCVLYSYEEVEKLSETEREDKGFGSSGK